MSPSDVAQSPSQASFPRLRGDEPLTRDLSVYYYSFSPPTRG